MKKNLALNFTLLSAFTLSMTGMVLAISVESKEMLTLFVITSVMVVASAVTVWRGK